MSIFTRGGSQTTIERIDWRSTLQGILAFAGLMVGCRLLALGLLCTAALAIGRAAGLFFLASATLLSLRFGWEISPSRDRNRYWAEFWIDQKDHEVREAVIWLVAFGLLALGAWAFGYWPRILRWQIHQGTLRYQLAETSFLWWAWGGRWVDASPALIAVRVFAVTFLPAILYGPLWIAHWAARIEVVAPKVREAHTATINPSNFNRPDGRPIQGVQHVTPDNGREREEESSLIL
jgi:hypothetical protein